MRVTGCARAGAMHREAAVPYRQNSGQNFSAGYSPANR